MAEEQRRVARRARDRHRGFLERHPLPPVAWRAFLAVAATVALLRLAAGTLPLAPLIDAAWGLAAVSAMGVGISYHAERGRVAWSLFSLSVLCGAASMTLYPFVATAPSIEVVRDALDLGAYVFGGIGVVVFARSFGSRDPDAWLDAAAVGVALSLIVFELVFDHNPAITAAGRSAAFSLMVAGVNAVVFTIVARFVIRPVASPSLSVLGSIIGLALVLDVGYYATFGMPRNAYEAMWLLAYGAWAAGSLHPDTARLIARARQSTRAADETTGAYVAIGLHSAGFIANLLAVWSHMAKAPGQPPTVFLVIFLLQVALVATRSARIIRRLTIDDARRRSAESAMRESEERFRRLAEVAPVGIFLTDATGRLTYVNDAWTRVNGVAPGTRLEDSLDAVVHPDDLAELRAQSEASIRDQTAYDIQHRLVRADGSIAWVHANSTPLLDAAGNQTGRVGTVADVTGLVEARAAAQEREAFVNGLIEQAPVGIEVYGPDGRSMTANLAQRELRARLAPDTTRPADVRDDPLMLRLGQRDAILAAFGGHAAAGSEPVRVPAPEGDARGELDVRLTWFPLRDPAGAVTAVISFLEDVTDSVRAERERRDVEARLQEVAKLEALGVLAGGIAHDFNNLLVAILGHASLARAQLGDTSAVDRDLESVETAARRAADLARQMLAYSGRGSFRVGAVDVEALLREMGDLLARSIAKSATLRHEFTPDLPPVVADATQLRQVALNLIVNASDALGDRPGTITLRTRLAEVTEDEPDVVPGITVTPGAYVLLEVEDTGAGMDEATLARIFDPFFTTKTMGRGLGLAATLGIVRGHGGIIRVHSEPGRGTKVGVLLRPAELPASTRPVPTPGAVPTGRALAVADATSAPAPTMSAASSVGAGGRILIVDDEPTVRMLGRRVLERAGFTVVEAPDGPDGIEAFSAAPDSWAAVVLDLTLPTLDGMAVLSEIRRVRPGVPAVVCSGWAGEEVSARLAAMPGTQVLEKPYAPAALVAVLRAGIEAAAASAAATGAVPGAASTAEAVSGGPG